MPSSPLVRRARGVRPLHRARLFVARRPAVYWLLVAIVAALTAGLVLDRAAAADAARRRWGDDRVVAVAQADLAAGHAIVPGDLRIERWPIAVVPPDAVATVEVGAVVASPIAAGEAAVAGRLGRPGGGPVASVLPRGTRAVLVPSGESAPPVAPGDRVDLVAAGLALDGQVVARDALVVRIEERAVAVAVNAAELPAVAGALVNGTVVLAISGDPPAGG